MKRLGSIFADTSRLHHRYHHSIFERFNLHRGQCRIFIKLKDSEGISQKELASRMNISPATLTRMVQNMEKNGYITRKTSEADQRITLIHLTEKGIETRAIIDKKLKAIDEKIFKNFNEEERKILEDMLLRIQKQLLEEIDNENDH